MSEEATNVAANESSPLDDVNWRKRSLDAEEQIEKFQRQIGRVKELLDAKVCRVSTRVDAFEKVSSTFLYLSFAKSIRRSFSPRNAPIRPRKRYKREKDFECTIFDESLWVWYRKLAIVSYTNNRRGDKCQNS